MEANFDLIVSGCDTRCAHCYVHGGPGIDMPTEDALLCIGRLDELASLLPYPASFTLDNEPFRHPDVERIIRAASSARHAAYYHHGMTTGVALMRRRDRDDILKAYMDGGHDTFGVTLHGAPARHDAIVRRKGAHEVAMDAARYVKSRGAKLSVSLMLNRFFPEDADAVDGALDRLQPDSIWFAIPVFTPHADMCAFEPFRATLADLQALSPRLERWRQDESLLREAERNTAGAAADRLEGGLSLKELFAQKQEEQYLTVRQDCRLYYGNTGAETACLGDLRTLDLRRTAETIASLPGNRDYGAFYGAEALPREEELARALRGLPDGLLFGDGPSALYRGLDALGVPTRILRLPAPRRDT